MKTPILHVTATALGVKARCRKVTRETFTLGDHPLDSDVNTLAKVADAAIKVGMRTCERATLHMDYAETEKCDGFESLTLKLFDERSKRFDLGLRFGV